MPLSVPQPTPFAGGIFPTPSGKVELYSQQLADEGLDPLPAYLDQANADNDQLGRSTPAFRDEDALNLVTGAAHHFVSSSLANQAGLLKGAGPTFVEIHPEDAAARGIAAGDSVFIENARGWCRLRAVLTDAVRRGVVVSPKGRWCKMNGGRNVNWTTSDALADMAGQSTFHSNRVWLRRAE